MKINYFFQKGWFYIFLNVQESPQQLPNSWLMHMERKNQVFKKIWFAFIGKYLHNQCPIFFACFCHPILFYKYQALCTNQKNETLTLKTTQTLAKIFKILENSNFKNQPDSRCCDHSIVLRRFPASQSITHSSLQLPRSRAWALTGLKSSYFRFSCFMHY